MATVTVLDYIKNITSQRDSAFVKFPDQEDLEGSAVALMRLQDTYKLDTRDIAEGRIQGVQRTAPLDAHDCFEIGRIAYNQRDYYHTLMWMEEAQMRMLREDPPTVQETEILEYLAFAMYQQGNVKRALRMTKRLYKLQPDHPRAKGNIKYYEDMLVEEGFKKGDDGELPPVVNQRKEDGGISERDIYEALCRGEKLKVNLAHPEHPQGAHLELMFQSDYDLSRLYCHYKTDNPFLKLAPLKVEILHWKPKIVLYRGVVSDPEIEVIKELASPKVRKKACVLEGVWKRKSRSKHVHMQ